MSAEVKKRSIARGYFISVVLVVLGSMVLLASIFLTLATQYIHSESMHNLDVAAQCVSQVLTQAEEEMDDPWAQAALAAYSATLVSEVTDASILAVNPAGDILYQSEGLELLGNTLSASVLQKIQGNINDGLSPCLRQVTDLDGLLSEKYYVVGSTYESADGINRLLVLSDAGRLQGYLSELIVSFVWASVFMLVISGIIALWTAQHISAPLSQLSRAADKFGRGDFTARVTLEQPGNDEIALLAQNFNTMAANLEAIDRSRQSFMGNIAHELRTPMTSIKGFIDGMLDGVIPAEQYPKYLGLVSEEVARLTRLIQSMLDITKLEAGEYAVNARNYDVWETIGAVLMNNEQRLIEGRIGIGGYDPQYTAVYADSDLIYQVVYNIVDNAIKFTPEGGRIDLSVTSDKERVYVTVRNTGEGIPADQLPYLFERFYKGDKSRGLHARGAGLGMHISKVLIGVSGGSIRVDSDSESWTAFSFDLPVGRPELPPRRERGGKMMKFRSKNKQS